MAGRSKAEKNPSLKDPELYETLRDQGYSKEKSARISNAKANPHMDPSRKGGRTPAYEEWTRDDLYKRASEIGIDGRSNLSKQGLIDALRHH